MVRTRSTPVWVGLDGAKDTLDLASRPAQRPWRTANDAGGMARVVRWLQAQRPAVIVVEATGGYERALTAALHASHLPVAVVNPREVRDVARATAPWPRQTGWMRPCWRCLPSGCSPRPSPLQPRSRPA